MIKLILECRGNGDIAALLGCLSAGSEDTSTNTIVSLLHNCSIPFSPESTMKLTDRDVTSFPFSLLPFKHKSEDSVWCFTFPVNSFHVTRFRLSFHHFAFCFSTMGKNFLILKLLNRKPFSLNAIANNPQNDTNCDLCWSNPRRLNLILYLVPTYNHSILISEPLPESWS